MNITVNLTESDIKEAIREHLKIHHSLFMVVGNADSGVTLNVIKGDRSGERDTITANVLCTGHGRNSYKD